MITPEDDLRHRDLPRDSLYWNILLPEAGLAAVFYLVTHPDASQGAAAVAIFRADEESVVEGDFTSPREGDDFDDCRVGPLRLQIKEPHRVHEVTYQSERVQLDYRFDALHDVFDYSSNANGSPPPMAVNRLEQAGRIKGTLSLDGRTYDFDTTGERDHSWGPRIWGGMQHYRWISGQAGPDLAFNVMVTLFRGERMVNGFVYRDGETVPVIAVDTQIDFTEEMYPASPFALQLHDAKGRTTDVQTVDEWAKAFLPWEDHEFTETAFRCEIEGQPGIGIVEMQWAPGYLDLLKDSPIDHTQRLVGDAPA